MSSRAFPRRPFPAGDGHGRVQPAAAGVAAVDVMSRVLVIDDEPEIGQILRLVLESRGHAVSVAVDPIDGLATALRQRPDVIVLDLLMPIMDGYAFLEQLRADERTRDVRVVVLSVVTNAAARERCMDLGAVGFITKPFDPYEVASEIERVSSGRP